MQIIRNLLWIDCTAGALVGALLLLLAGLLKNFYSLPLDLLYFMGAMNLLYAAYSFSLAIRRNRSRTMIFVLVAANAAWALVCLSLAIYFFDTANLFGIGQLVGEAIFVGGLATLEWSGANNSFQRLNRH